MEIIMYLAIFMVIVGALFLCTFLFAVKNGQFEDLETPAHKLLLDDHHEIIEQKENTKTTHDVIKK